ncbi:hypothetical protein SAMN05428989_2391 [Pseudoxanthomonas sp. GM95]|uniref:hypothetical protein n=1 Tax=Pseudoxanthomonas sp. GM95 TaxID=1881043 RepID=UPI0008D6E0D4|nr:hypothetical protein [Pseudoxanthomonas sp. GM95]SEL74337.1 hypothetical protein SAMN05428989_2391 [Pseudoxanthomonas sp. GM95]
MRLRCALFTPLLAAAVLLAGCAAPANTTAPQTAPSDTPAPAPAANPAPAPATGTPVEAPVTAAPSPAPTTPVKVDTSCKRDADCAVKNVGSCCGELPACVNADSPTDPAAVQAQCQASGRMGICGFRQISACQCQAGTCQPANDGTGLLNSPSPAPLPIR